MDGYETLLQNRDHQAPLFVTNNELHDDKENSSVSPLSLLPQIPHPVSSNTIGNLTASSSGESLILESNTSNMVKNTDIMVKPVHLYSYDPANLDDQIVRSSSDYYGTAQNNSPALIKGSTNPVIDEESESAFSTEPEGGVEIKHTDPTEVTSISSNYEIQTGQKSNASTPSFAESKVVAGEKKGREELLKEVLGFVPTAGMPYVFVYDEKMRLQMQPYSPPV